MLLKKIIKLIIPNFLLKQSAKLYNQFLSYKHSNFKKFQKINTSNEFSNKWNVIADKKNLGKADNYTERFREIISDPINLLIDRVPEAGYLNKNMEVTLHNGNLVSIDDKLAYYGIFSDILVINRGVHEPLEEFCFQELIRLTSNNTNNLTMIELGSYWGHYSMWFKKKLPSSRCILIEPEKINLEIGKKNFDINNLKAEFINEFVSSKNFTVDKFLDESSLESIYLLHSDIQGYELEMLQNSKIAMSKGKINYLMISTHGSEKHRECINEINKYDYTIEINSDPDHHSTSHDGLLFIRKNSCKPIINITQILGRIDIAKSSSKKLIEYLTNIQNLREK